MIYIDILDEAKHDLYSGVNFYESQLCGLEDYFFDSVTADIESLYIYCGIHIKIKNCYRLLSKRFPYAIYCKYNNDTIFIYAILDCRSSPKEINDRLDLAY